MNRITPFERDVMVKLLEGAEPEIAVLRGQFENALISKRNNTEAGFYLHFWVPKVIPRLSPVTSSPFR